MLVKYPLLLSLALVCAMPAHAADVTVDESALRYYAAHNEPERLQAEIRRLQALYPDWQVPTDLDAPAGDREAALWEIYKSGDMAALDAAIAELKAASPGYEPSADLAAKIALRKARDSLIKASDAGDQAKVLEIAAGNATQPGCTDLDVSWRVAAARAGTGDKAGALTLYGQLLDDCGGAPERLATMQKAIATLDRQMAHGLLAKARTPGEFDALRPDFARAAIAAALTDGTAEEPDPLDLAALEAAAQAGPKPDDAGLLGWWRRSRHEADKALAAFSTAATLAGQTMDAKIAEGLVLSYEDLGRRADAVRVAHDNRQRSDELARLYVDLGAAMFSASADQTIAAADLADYGEVVSRLRSAKGAELLGWYRHNGKDDTEARTWFERGLEWEPSESLASGAVYAALALKDREGAKALIARWRSDFPAIADIKVDAPSPGKGGGKDAIIAAFEAKDYGRCVALATSRSALKADLSLIKGWCLMKLSRPAEARAAFVAALSGKGKVREDAAYGKSLAEMALGDVHGSVATAMDGVSDTKRRAEIAVAALADEAQARFNARDWRGALSALDRRAAFAGETTDLAMLRGWSLWHIGERQAAKALFVRLDDVLSTRETRQALATMGGRS